MDMHERHFPNHSNYISHKPLKQQEAWLYETTAVVD